MTPEEETGHGVPGARLDALTDGVIAIAITLLVLELRLPEEIGHLDGAAMWRLLAAMRPQFAGYGISFIVVGTLWISHVQVLRGQGPADAATVWMTLGFLALVALVPFTTALLSRSHGVVATVVYAGTMGLASLLLGLMARRRRGTPGVAGLAGDVVIALVFAASIGIAFWNPMAARLCWLLILPVSLSGLLRRRRL